MNEETLVKNIAHELARVYAVSWKQAFNSSILTAEEWADANWESFCGEAWAVIDKSK